MSYFKAPLAALAISVAAALPSHAQDASANTVVATVNGKDITLGHMIVVRAGLPEQYAQLPAEVLYEGILDQLIQQAALADTVGEAPTRARIAIENETRAILASEVLEAVLAREIPEAELKAAYDAQFGEADPETEYHAAHILVETEAEANEIVDTLNAGADFANLAKEKSTGPSGPNGGDLGWFGKGMMVPAFEEAVIAMDTGTISDPVQTQFGWHVIKLYETRQADIPSFEEMREELDAELRQATIDAEIQKITDAATVEKPQTEIDPALISDLSLLQE